MGKCCWVFLDKEIDLEFDNTAEFTLSPGKYKFLLEENDDVVIKLQGGAVCTIPKSYFRLGGDMVLFWELDDDYEDEEGEEHFGIIRMNESACEVCGEIEDCECKNCMSCGKLGQVCHLSRTGRCSNCCNCPGCVCFWCGHPQADHIDGNHPGDKQPSSILKGWMV